MFTVLPPLLSHLHFSSPPFCTFVLLCFVPSIPLLFAYCSLVTAVLPMQFTRMKLLHCFMLLRTSSAFLQASSHRVVSTTAVTAAAKEICETTITDNGKAEVLCTISNEDDRSSLWSNVAINAAKQFTITQRKKLQELGALDVPRPVKIIGSSVSDTCGLGDCVLSDDESSNAVVDNSEADTKIIHFQRHGQGKLLDWLSLL